MVTTPILKRTVSLVASVMCLEDSPRIYEPKSHLVSKHMTECQNWPGQIDRALLVVFDT